MSSFTDSTGTTWAVSLAGDAPRRVLVASNVNLFRVCTRPSALQQLSNPILMGAALWGVCAEQAMDLGVSPEEFAHRLTGAMQSATNAFLAEYLKLMHRQLGGNSRKALARIAADSLGITPTEADAMFEPVN